MRQIAQLSLPAFEVLWEDLRAGSVPYPFEVSQHGETLDERARIKAAVRADLERRNLARRGRPEPDLEDALNLLARPELRVVALCIPDLNQQKLVRASVVARGGYAVLVTQEDTSITLNLVQPNEIATSLAGAMPQNRPGPGKLVTVPAEAFENQPQQQEGFRQAVRAMENDDVRIAKQMLTGPAIGNGHFVVQMGQGRTRRDFPPVTWIDTHQGRYSNVQIRNGWFTISPADNMGLARHLGQVLAMTSER
ncbi:ESAT-6 protein secretion system EspG family protein [Lentzea atacamensis]|uniref:ESAT-6 protein secretion system EspG family protein n=1 Tax=Lentzea atacamensis TaxID=531938 RepID=A0ABX9E1U0_9PSEU|nr:ESX secretion-associated protein EspG [Lentzea atacamensis]RAS60705.1 ESAT-6 protein secretion system EspG family protein [Lentzea atacamensis]